MTLLQQHADQRILILDGAMGTMIQAYGLNENDFRGQQFQDTPGLMKGNNDILNLTRPDIIREIHRKYLEAGADIISTNTFSSQIISMEDYHVADVAHEIAAAGCRIARELADEFTALNPEKPRFVAGSVGPTNKSCSISPDIQNPAMRAITFDELVKAYFEQMCTMIRAQVDIILIETAFDTLNAKTALYAARQAMQETGREVDIMLSATLADSAGRTLSGQTLDAFIASVSHYPLFSIGLNCSFGAAQMRPFLRHLASHAPFRISVHPNAGLPNALGEYDMSPVEMKDELQSFVDEGLVNIIGGCCGTTEEFIRLYPSVIAGRSPHQPVAPASNLQLSGMEMLELTPERKFINVGERCNVAGSRKFLRLINERNFDEALEIARHQVEDGAQVLDVNMDDALLDAKAEMTHFLNLMGSDPDIASVPVMIDSSKWEVIHAGLRCVQGKAIVNSISLKEGEETFLAHGREIKEMGAAVVVMAFDEQGQATTFERKIEICERAYNLLVHQVGLPAHDIIFDPNVLSVATGIDEHRRYAIDFIEATGWIKEHLPHAHVSGGISNLSFSFRGNNYIREAMHAVFLYHAIGKGMDFGIINPSTSVTYSDIPDNVLTAIEDVLFDRHDDATDQLISLAEQVRSQSTGTATAASAGDVADPLSLSELSVEERLQFALLKGRTDTLDVDLDEAVEKYGSPTAVIEGPLMSAMNYIGDLFGAGKLFLPQVVKTARTMKRAVDHLMPLIQAASTVSDISAGKVLMATVKGDVHDIGKNIVGIILSCNGYDIIDLGVMVPAERIIEEAQKQQVDIVALSGLITPSLDEMVNVAKLLQQSNMRLPLMIGGATTSALHTALRIAPVYDGPVLWVKDASQNVIAAAQILSPDQRDTYIENLRQRQEQLRQNYTATPPSSSLSLSEARNQRLNLF